MEENLYSDPFMQVFLAFSMACIWLAIAFKVFRFDKLASRFFNAPFVVYAIGFCLLPVAIVFALVFLATNWIVDDRSFSINFSLAATGILIIVGCGIWLSDKHVRYQFLDFVLYEVPDQIRNFLKIKVDRQTEQKNTDLILKLASEMNKAERETGWYYFLATTLYIGTYFLLYVFHDFEYHFEYMEWWKKYPILLGFYLAYMMLYREIYRARFIKNLFASVVVILEAAQRNDEYFSYYDYDDGEHYGLCLLDEKPTRYPDTPNHRMFVDIGDGELGYLIRPTIEYEEFINSYVAINNLGVKGYLDWLNNKTLSG